MDVPTTDAFDETNDLESLEVELPAQQIEWLHRAAESQNRSVDHVLRTIITMHLRSQNTGPAAPAEEDSSPPSDGSSSSSNDGARAPHDASSPSIVDSLRTATEQLQDLTKQDETEEPGDADDPSDLRATLARLDPHLKKADRAEDSPHETLLLDRHRRSMFDLMQEEE